MSDAIGLAGASRWDFAGKVAIVTGSARGIGKTIATAFGRAGAHVAVCDINQSAALETVAALRGAGISAHHIWVDLAKAGEPQRMINEVAEKFGNLHFLVNNARAGARRTWLEETEDNWDLGLSVGLRGAYFAAREAIPVMARSGGGSIVNVCSVAAFLVSLESPGYHAAKAGLLQMTRYLAVNCGPLDVRVNAVLPGFIVQDEHRERYERDDNAGYRAKAEGCHPARRVGRASDVAEAVLFLCSGSSAFVTGQSIVVDGGFTAQDPWLVMSGAAGTAGAK